MFFRKKPKRLYLPTSARWYTRPRQTPGTLPRIRHTPLLSPLLNFLKHRITLVVIGIALLLLITILATSSYFAVSNIEVARENFNIDVATIENELNKYIGKNILFLPKRTLVATVQKQLPEFRSVAVHKVWPDTLRINLISHDIVANLRAYYTLPESKEETPIESSALNRAIRELELGETPPDPFPTNPKNPPTNTQAFSLDPLKTQRQNAPQPIEQKGLLNAQGQAIFDQEENLELMTISIRGLTQPIEDRQVVIPQGHMDYIQATIQYFNSLIGLEVSGLDYLPGAQEVHIKTLKGPAIWLATDKDFKEQLDKLKIIYEPAELNKEELNYIDLRVKEKVIYCPQRASCAQ